MRKIISFFIVFVMFITIAKAESFEVRNFTNFSSVYLFGNLSVRLVKSDSTYAVIKGDSAAFSKVTTKINNEELIVKYNKIGSSKTITIVIFYKTINEIIGKAGVTIVANQAMESQDLKINLSNGSEADLEINTTNMKSRVNQGSILNIKGSVEQLELSSTTGAVFNGKKLNVKNANLRVATGGDITLTLSGDVEATAHTGGSISYFGTPKSISQSTSTGGEVTQKK
ncbi:MAG: hypothetical protein DRI86_02265 [Bacteroidetes bacterium]|nr:MAG: hypothetical protein DRI86_02265 [Bacteroidota bacterium]